MTTIAALFIAAVLLGAYLGFTHAKRKGDRQLDALLSDLHAEAERQAGIQAGFDAGWHGAGGRS